MLGIELTPNLVLTTTLTSVFSGHVLTHRSCVGRAVVLPIDTVFLEWSITGSTILMTLIASLVLVWVRVLFYREFDRRIPIVSPTANCLRTSVEMDPF